MERKVRKEPRIAPSAISQLLNYQQLYGDEVDGAPGSAERSPGRGVAASFATVEELHVRGGTELHDGTVFDEEEERNRFVQNLNGAQDDTTDRL